MLRLCCPRVLAVLVVLTALAGPAGASLLVLDARCVDVESRTVRPASVWIEDGRVRAVGGPDGSGLDLGGARPDTLDLAGRHLMPSLIDLRVYGDVQRSPGHRDSLGIDGARRLAASVGVARVVDLFSTGERTGGDAADWFGAGPLLVPREAPEAAFPGARPVDSPAMARSVIEGLPARTTPLQVVYDGRYARGLDAKTLQALIDAAAPRPVVVQVADWVDVRVALENGARWFAQIPTGPMPDDVRATIERRGAELTWTPQVALGLDFGTWARVDSLRRDPGLARVLPDTMREDYARLRIPQTRLGEVDARARLLSETLPFLDAAGVRLLPGSGAGAVGTAVGFSLVRELEWWIALGIDPWRALGAATLAAGEVLGVRTGFAPGAVGDFSVLAGSPLDDPTVLRAPERLILGGAVVDPGALAATVEHRVVEELPDNPLPLGGRVPLIVIVVAGFAVLLLLRRAVKRAAARALAEDEGTD